MNQYPYSPTVTIAITNIDDLCIKRPSGCEVYMIPNIPVEVSALLHWMQTKFGESEAV